MTAPKPKLNQKSRLDNKNKTISTPIDFSFLSLNDLSELQQEDPRSGIVVIKKEERKRPPPDPKEVARQQAKQQSSIFASLQILQKGQQQKKQEEEPETEIVEIRQFRGTTIRLNNNNLKSCDGLYAALDTLLVDGANCVLCLDLGWNPLKTIPDDILDFPSLHTLNMQSCQIADYHELAKLHDIPSLRFLSLAGNPVDQLKYYRQLLIATCPQVTKIDSTLISRRERELAEGWFKTYRMKLGSVMQVRLPFSEAPPADDK
ncbi:hypothetical protein BLNAU_15455 [Blattamonas nauphoetae]|uniref:Leucine-rich repeat-containing protein 51 n=1 Tax=Blattamonas nauphoetae TaxID=2049346 RepID=A0ABQ9XDZ1_9EUKA|nr:hypothetical protein BLNAU_15455 [Blattamonas nauphoetae]